VVSDLRRGVTEKVSAVSRRAKVRERERWDAAKVLRPLSELNCGAKPGYGGGMPRLRRMVREREANLVGDRLLERGGSGARRENAETATPAG